MKKTLFQKWGAALLFMLSGATGFAQTGNVGIGTVTPNGGATLEIASLSQTPGNSTGLLAPRLPLAGNNVWTLAGTPTDGMIVFNTATVSGTNGITPGYYYWYNNQWLAFYQTTAATLPASATINCGSITNAISPQATNLVNGTFYNGTITVPYTAGNGGAFTSDGITQNGLTFSRPAGTLSNGNGNILYGISGTYSGPGGSETVLLNLPGNQCSVILPQQATFAGGSLACSGYPATGQYIAGTAAGSNNTKAISIIPSSPGSYNFTTNTVNGLTFAASVNFSLAQVGTAQIVNLVASGTPLNVGSNNYSLTVGAQSCIFGITSVDASSGGTSVVSTWNCTGANTGTLVAGIAANGVSRAITAIVTTAGTYNLSTDTVNGVYYYGSGIFSGTGSQTITLAAGGTPVATGTFTHMIRSTPNCSFSTTTGSGFPSSGGSAIVSAYNCAGADAGLLMRGVAVNGVTRAITATVSTTGTYNIITDTVNGLYYRGSGIFSSTGSQTITLTAIGTPVATGTSTFTLKTNPSCTFSRNTIDPSSGGSSIVNAWNCVGTNTGIVMAGVPASGITRTITATVGTAGSYEISTDTVNGIYYYGAGLFSGTGNQTITLTAGGTPIAATSGTYTLRVTPNCNFSITAGQASSGSAVISAFNCSGTDAGTLQRGVAATGVTHTITATVTTAGSYNLVATANGITFSGSGTFSGTGSQTITLTATGTPTTAGTNSFGLNTTPGCSFTRIITDPSTGGSAIVSAWNCSGANNGTMIVGIPVSGVTHVITATVSTVGTYNVSTDTVNGIYYLGSGTFSGTGSQTVTLTASGTPTAAINSTYTLKSTPNCNFSAAAGAGNLSSGGSAVISAFNCSGTDVGALQVAVVAGGVTRTITATVTTAGSYNISAVANGVTFSGSGTLSTGTQTITLTASGTPTAAGTATFALSTTPTCNFTRNILNSANFNCAAIAQTQSPTGALTNGVSYTGTVTIPYTSGNGTAYSSVTLGPVKGLTLTRVAGSYSGSGGNVVYNLSGTFTGPTNDIAEFTGFTECPASTVVFGDAIRGALQSAGCASCTSYDTAAQNTWVQVTKAEYDALITFVPSSYAAGASTSLMNSTAHSPAGGGYTWSNYDTPIPPSSYIIGFVVGTSSSPSNPVRSGGKVKVGTAINDGFAMVNSVLPDHTVVANGANYFIAKRPNTATANSNTYLAFYDGSIPVGVRQLGGTTTGVYYGGGDASTLGASSGTQIAIQTIVATAKSW